MAAIQFTEATKAYPRTIAPAGKYPIVGDRIYRTLQDAQDYVDGKSSSKSAIPGIYLSVIADGTNNGAYWVEQAAGYDGATVGVLRKMGAGGGIASISFELGSDTDNAVSLDINGEKKSISVETLRTSLGLKSFAYEGIDADDLEGVLSEGEGISYTDGEISLAPVYNLTAGDYIGVTVDKYGRVTKGRSAIEIGDVTGLSAKFGDYVLLTDYDEEINRINTKFSDYVLRTDYDKDINDSEAGLAARIAKIEGWFELDDNNNIRTTYNFYSTKQIASGGIGDASGSGLGLILSEWPTDSEDYSKYALGGNLGIELNTRLTAVEGKATNVTVSPTLSQGKPMGTIMVDGVSQTMYAPATYSADDILPTQERNFVSLQDIEYWNTAYLPKTGGAVDGPLTVNGAFQADEAIFSGYVNIDNCATISEDLTVNGALTINGASVATQTWADGRYVRTSGRGVITSPEINVLYLNSTSSYNTSAMVLRVNGANKAYFGVNDTNGAFIYNYAASSYIGVKPDGTPHYNGAYTLIHSGNIGSYNAGSATKLETARTIWGQSFDGTGNIEGNINNVTYIRFKDSGIYGIYRGMNYSDNLTANDLAYVSIQHAFYTSGYQRLFINQYGNVTIGSSDLAGSDSVTPKLYISGNTRLAGSLYFTDGAYISYTNIHLPSNDGSNAFNIYGSGNLTLASFYSNGKTVLGRQGNVGIGTTGPQYKLDVNGTARFNGNIVLASDFTVNATSWHLSFGINGALITSDVRASWRSSIFGSAGAGSRIKTVRTDVTIDNFSEKYGNGLAWASGDTHGYIGVSHGSKQAFIGGGSSDKLSWTAKLFHNEMTLEPYKDNVHQIGSASKRYTNAYLSNSVRIGNAILSWDSANNALKIEGNVYATGQVASGGIGTAVATIASDHEDRIAQLEAKVESLMS